MVVSAMASQPPKNVDTTNANAVRDWLESRIKAGAIKDCANLGIGSIPVHDASTGELEREFFAPICKQESFEFIYLRPPMRLRMQLLEYRLDTNPISCPTKCHYYRRPGWAKIKRGLKTTGSFFAEPFAWFAKAAWQTQVSLVAFIALIVVLSLFPRWIPLLTDLINAIRGK